MDEPFGALDAQARGPAGRNAAHLGQDRKAVVFVTHSISEAIFLVDRIVIMGTRSGCVKEMVDPQLAHPRKRTDADFIALERHLKHLVRAEVQKLGVQ
jgi:NitT/TauT family transport system ATP-binding protein